MHPLLKKIAQIVTDQQLVSSGDAVVVGVSAGPDSMALLHLLAGLQGELGLQLTAVYVNHGLRPHEVEAEAELVQRSASKLGIGCKIVEVDVQAEAERHKKSLEHMARDLRYQALEQVTAEMAGAKIAVAHTADDQAEEIIIRLLRGAGRGGLSGMRLMRDGHIIRPLLTVSKKEVFAFLKDNDIPYLLDSSNEDLRFLRNQVRLEILPFLKKYNPGLENTLRRSAAILQDEEDILAQEARDCWLEVVKVWVDDNDMPLMHIDAQKFAALHPAMQRRVTEMMLIALAAQPDSRQIEQFLHLANKGQGNSQLHFSKGLRIRKQQGVLICSYPEGRVARRGDLA